MPLITTEYKPVQIRKVVTKKESMIFPAKNCSAAFTGRRSIYGKGSLKIGKHFFFVSKSPQVKFRQQENPDKNPALSVGLGTPYFGGFIKFKIAWAKNSFCHKKPIYGYGIPSLASGFITIYGDFSKSPKEFRQQSK